MATLLDFSVCGEDLGWVHQHDDGAEEAQCRDTGEDNIHVIRQPSHGKAKTACICRAQHNLVVGICCEKSTVCVSAVLIPRTAVISESRKRRCSRVTESLILMVLLSESTDSVRAPLPLLCR